MNQEKSKQIIAGMAFSHSDGLKNLLASMSGKHNIIKPEGFEKQFVGRRIPEAHVVSMMNRSVTL